MSDYPNLRRLAEIHDGTCDSKYPCGLCTMARALLAAFNMIAALQMEEVHKGSRGATTAILMDTIMEKRNEASVELAALEREAEDG